MLKKDAKAFLDKVADDEPIFILRAQDATMPRSIRQWCRHLRFLYEQAWTLTPTAKPELLAKQNAKLNEAYECALLAEQWGAVEGRAKTPD